MYYFFILAYFFFQIRVWYCICACLNIFKHWTWFKQIWKTILKIVDDFICNIYVRKMWLPVKISYKICFYCKEKIKYLLFYLYYKTNQKMLWLSKTVDSFDQRQKQLSMLLFVKPVCQDEYGALLWSRKMTAKRLSIQLLNMRPDTWLSVDKTCNNCCMCATDFLKIKTRKHTF